MQKKIIIILTVLIFVFLFCSAASAATVKNANMNGVKINKVGSYNIGVNYPQISGTRVVWEQYDGNKTAIYCKNLATGNYAKVLPTDKHQHDPAISGTRVVWVQRDGKNLNIYCKNIATGVYGLVSKNSTNFKGHPAISGKLIVWTQLNATFPEDPNDHFSIYCKNLATGQIFEVSKSIYDQEGPHISGTRVIWTEYGATQSFKSVIYCKNLATGISQKIHSSNQSHQALDISGTRILWKQNMDNIQYIFCLNLANGRIDRVRSIRAVIYGSISGTSVVWGEFSKVFIKNLATGKISRVYNAMGSQDMISISGSRVVWIQWTFKGYLIFVKNFTTGLIGIITPKA